MKNSRRITRVAALCLGALTIASEARAEGESLTISIPTPSLELYAPIVIDVTLELDTPYTRVRNDPREAARQDRRIRRRLVAEIREADELVVSAFLYGGQFAPSQDAATEFHATLLGCFGTRQRGTRRNEFEFWDRPGRYIVVVRDTESALVSNEIAVEISTPDDRKAAQLFQSGGTDTLMLLFNQRYGEDMAESFRELADDFPGTIYGKYATISLAQRDVESLRRPSLASASALTRTVVAQQLSKAVQLFQPGHPLRNHGLLSLARLQLSGDSKQTIDRLLVESRDGGITKKGREFLLELARRKQVATEAVDE